MAVKIRLKRLGKIRAPYYRVVVMDSRTKRDGRAIEEIGKYHPTHEPSVIEIDSPRAQYWLGVGAQPTEQVTALLKVTGDWQKFKGLPGTEGTLRTAEPKADKRALYEAALRASGGQVDEQGGSATTARKRAPRKAEPTEAAPTDAAAAATEAAPAEAATESAPAETASAEAAPESAPAESAPVEAAAAESDAAAPAATEAAPAETASAETVATESDAAAPATEAAPAGAAATESGASTDAPARA